MTKIRPLEPEKLLRRCDPSSFGFATTDELEDLQEVLGQERAVEAVRFGIGIRRDGYNLYVLGPTGTGKKAFVRRLLESRAPGEPRPDDWCYVHNFEQPHRPRALRLPPGRGAKLKADMQQLVEELRAAIPAVFESDEYRARAEHVDGEFSERQEKAFGELGQEAAGHGIALLHTPSGFSFAPTRNGEVISPDDYAKLPEEERARIVAVVAELEEKLQKLIRQVPRWRKERRERIKTLNREMTMLAVGHLIDELKEEYAGLDSVCAYLDAVREDVLENIDEFRKPVEGQAAAGGALAEEPASARRYRANLLVGDGAGAGAPVVFEDNPNYNNLIGRVEHVAQFGALMTDFTLIKAGALHRANGGYLLLDAYKLLTQPFAWDALKRALNSKELRMDSLGQMLSLVSTVSLEPEPIPLDLKVILFGERLWYYLLHAYDPEFGELFKVGADFDDRVERDEASHMAYARLVATIAREEELRPFDRGAVARVVEHGARLVGDAGKLTTHMQSIVDLLRESDHFATETGHGAVAAADVQRAIAAQIRRADRVRERVHEAILRGVVFIDTAGERAGQVNGLSVFELGGFAFAQPSRITATTRLGEGEVVDIEREVDLSGSIHSKGVLILSSFLAARYSRNRPLALSASLTFEQNYGGVEGDSASVAELAALLSSLADVPIRQTLAVTGSVNQHGEVQPIGAVNEKIEGFFDICRARGLDGSQGVLIPASNVQHLMLREDVVEAVRAGMFAVYPVQTVDQALELLTGFAAGEPDAAGNYPTGSVNQRVVARLAELMARRQALAGVPRHKKPKRHHE
ncbi:MAG TPA: AAA family ATPase [Burkholderiales bacterium]|nr:AAA family ATPase [Burkholderiales bacterium]